MKAYPKYQLYLLWYLYSQISSYNYSFNNNITKKKKTGYFWLPNINDLVTYVTKHNNKKPHYSCTSMSFRCFEYLCLKNRVELKDSTRSAKVKEHTEQPAYKRLKLLYFHILERIRLKRNVCKFVKDKLHAIVAHQIMHSLL